MIKCCKGCTKRWVNERGRCHDTCEEYLDARAEEDAKKALIEKNRRGDLEVDGYLATAKAKTMHRLNRKVRKTVKRWGWK